MNKILIISIKREEWHALESSLQELTERGAELFFVEDEASALKIITIESPTVIILDSSFFNKNETMWISAARPLIVVREKEERVGLEDRTLFLPLNSEAVMDMVAPLISLEKEPDPIAL